MIEIQKEDFSIDKPIEGLRNPKIGAIVVYLGTVRHFSEGKEIESLEFEVDERRAKTSLEEIEGRVRQDFDIEDIAIVHRLGKLKVSDKILLIVVSAPHREPAFAACNYIIDSIKTLHTEWKREIANYP